MLACAWSQCDVLVTQRLVQSLPVAPEQIAQFDNASRIERSFVDDNPCLKWCTGADCTKAVRARKDARGVRCNCGSRFCFKCSQDDHTPCSCEELQRWMVKCKDDSETFNWLLSNTKACPKCGTSIEKNGGCNHSAWPHQQRRLQPQWQRPLHSLSAFTTTQHHTDRTSP